MMRELGWAIYIAAVFNPRTGCTSDMHDLFRACEATIRRDFERLAKGTKK